MQANLGFGTSSGVSVGQSLSQLRTSTEGTSPPVDAARLALHTFPDSKGSAPISEKKPADLTALVNASL